MKRLVYLLMGIAAVACTSRPDFVATPVDYVNPLIATCSQPEMTYQEESAHLAHANSRCFPGAQVPFGMVSLGPNTRNHIDANCGYDAHGNTVYGFSFMHMSGSSWYSEFGNFLTMATTGPLKTYYGDEEENAPGWKSEFDRESEKATPGYYSLFLKDYDILAECTATERVGALRFTFPESPLSRIQTDLAYRLTGTSAFQEVEMLSDSTFTGHMVYTDKEGGWGNGRAHINYELYFYATISKPVSSCILYDADIPAGWRRDYDGVHSPEYAKRLASAKVVEMSLPGDNSGAKPAASGNSLGVIAQFPTSEGEQVTLKVAFSFTSREGALRNYEAEAADKGFNEIRSLARSKWENSLENVRISGGTEDQKTIFYTALYHASIDPRLFCDVDGTFRGADGNNYKSSNYSRRTLFSGWDVFRSHMPLHTYLSPVMVQDEINSLVDLSQESGKGYYERWELLNSYTGCMLGSPAIPVLADAYLKGLRGFDVEKAYKVAARSSEVGDGAPSCFDNNQCMMSNIFEFAFDDWCLGRLAEAMGKNEDAKLYYQKAQAYRELFNSEVGWFIPKDPDGSWRPMPDKGLLQPFYGTCEANPLQQAWFVPHTPDSLAQLLGGRKDALAKLDDFFDHTPFTLGWTDYYNHGNEPVHLVPFLYNYWGEPWKAQKICRTIMQKLYTNDPEGLCGNDDEGQMSAWYVWVASGLHPACPASDRIEILSPIFDRVRFDLDKQYYPGGGFEVLAHNNSDTNIYVQKAALNGKKLDRCWISPEEFTSGGTLELWMGPEPSTWGVE